MEKPLAGAAMENRHLSFLRGGALGGPTHLTVSIFMLTLRLATPPTPPPRRPSSHVPGIVQVCTFLPLLTGK